MLKKLNSKHYIFIEEYIKNSYQGKKAYLKAYKSKNDQIASKGANRLLKEALILEEIERQEDKYVKTEYSATKQIRRLHDVYNESKDGYIVSYTKEGDPITKKELAVAIQAIKLQNKILNDKLKTSHQEENNTKKPSWFDQIRNIYE